MTPSRVILASLSLSFVVVACGPPEEETASSSEELTVAGTNLTAAQAKWVDYVGTNVVPRLPGTAAERARRAAIVVWWALKEGVLDVVPSPYRHNLCTQNGSDVRLNDLGICNGPAWQ